MKTKELLRLLLLLFLVCTGEAGAAGVSSKMNKMALEFSRTYTAREGAELPGMVAVFPFQADEKLTKKKIDFAVGEIFSRQLIETGSFKIVERVALNRILEEQSLSLSGAIETDSAVEVGKLAGAQLLVMGSIARMGKNYQVNTRLVDSGTGEVIAMDFAEIDAKIFEEEAKPYIALVPDKQAIGLQLTFGLSPFDTTAGPAVSYAGTTGNPAVSYTADTSVMIGDGDLNLVGLGVRYFPVNWLAIEATYNMPAKQQISFVTNYYDATDTIGTGIHVLPLNLYVRSMRFAGSYVHRLTNRVRGYAGVQLMTVSIGFDETSDSGPTLGYTDYDPMAIRLKDIDICVLPMARLGIEWNPQARIGVSVFGNIGLSSKEDVLKGIVDQRNGPVIETTTEVEIVTITKPAFYLEAAFSFYF